MGQGEDGSQPSITVDLGSAKSLLNARQFREAEAAFYKIHEYDPNSVEARIGLSTIYGATGRLPAAIAMVREAARLEPNNASALNLLASQLRTAGSVGEAVVVSRQAIEADPASPSGHFNLGLCYLTSREPALAAESFERAIAILPDFANYHYHVALAYETVARLSEARGSLARAVELANEGAPYHVKRGQLAISMGEPALAIESYRQALSLQPNLGGYFELGRLLMQERRLDEAEETLKAALALQAGAPQILELLSNVLREAGRFDEAIAAAEQVLRVQPDLCFLYFRIVSCKKIGAQDGPLVDRIEARLSIESQPENQRQLHYAAGKAFDDLGEYEKAMRHFDEANRLAERLQFAGHKLNRDQYREAFERSCQPFDRSFFDRYRNVGSGSELPIFIVGMIRSGTSLLEQILSSHSTVAGGGELQFWLSSESQRQMRNAATGSVDKEAISGLTESYLELLRGIGPSKVRVTDKMPANYMMLGLIHLAFPNARIVHCRRNAIDNALSIYATPYADPPRFAYDRSNIVFGLQEYARMMGHWRKALPPAVFLEVGYEDLVADQEATARRLVEFCGLEWDPACLKPEKNRTAVQTPSFWQVRQPVYTSSVERWRLYEPWLREFNQLK